MGVKVPIFNWHFPYMKAWRPVDFTGLVPYCSLKNEWLPDVMTDQETILRICRTFIDTKWFFKNNLKKGFKILLFDRYIYM